MQNMYQGNPFNSSAAVTYGNYFHTVKINSSIEEKGFRSCYSAKGVAYVNVDKGVFSNVSTSVYQIL